MPKSFLFQFWCVFINLATLLNTIVWQISSYLLSGRNSISFYLCLGKDSQNSWQKKTKINFQFYVTFIITIISYSITVMGMKFRKKKPLHLPPTVSQRVDWRLKNKWKLPSISHLIEKQALVDLATVALNLSFYGPIVWIAIYWANLPEYPDENIRIPYVLIAHFVQYELTFVWHCVVLVKYFAKSKSLRIDLLQKFKVYFSN